MILSDAIIFGSVWFALLAGYIIAKIKEGK